MMATKFGAVALGLAVFSGCGDSGREDSQGTGPVTAGTLTTLTGQTAGSTSSPEDPTGTSAASVTEAGTSQPGTSEAMTTSAPKFDLGTPAGADQGVMEGPIIPTTCAEAASGKSTVGCKFYAVDMDAHDLAEGLQYAIGVANVQLDGMATVTIETKEGGAWQTVGGPQPIGPLQLFTFPLADRHQDDTGVRVGGAYRVTSDVPVVAYQFNPVDGASSFLSDAAMLYPAAALDTVNHVTAWTSMMDNSNTFQHSYATVIATVDGTMVTVDPKTSTVGGAGVPAGGPGAPFTVPLQEGDVLNIAVESLGTSMTGTKITSNADHPVAVFAGQECALIPESVCCCDHMEEQLAGVRLWGKNFIAARMPLRNPSNP